MFNYCNFATCRGFAVVTLTAVLISYLFIDSETAEMISYVASVALTSVMAQCISC
jgi:hypothetical protein